MSMAMFILPDKKLCARRNSFSMFLSNDLGYKCSCEVFVRLPVVRWFRRQAGKQKNFIYECTNETLCPVIA